MVRLGCPGMSNGQKGELWDRWKNGESISEIARALAKPTGSVFTVLKSNGGYVPVVRRRRAGTLTATDREEISRGLACRESIRSIATRLGYAPSSVSREITRNEGVDCYRAARADERAWDQARRRKLCLLATNRPLGVLVAMKLKKNWSPEQIAGYLAKTYSPKSAMMVSRKTIYKSLFIQTRGVLAKELTKHLRSRRPTRRNIHNTVTGQHRSQIKEAVSIRERPASVEDRAIPGHWEGDLLLGRGLTQIATIVE